MQRIISVFSRELKRMTSKPIYGVVILLLPALCLLFFGTFMKDGLPEKLPIGVVDCDNSATSRNAIMQINATQQNEVIAHYPTFGEARAAMQEGKIHAFIEFPKDFEKDLLTNQQPELNFYYNPVYLISGSLLNKNLSTMSATISAAAAMKVMAARGITDPTTVMAQLQPIVPEVHAIGNPWINYSVYLINVILPGLVGLIILLMTVYSIGIELKEETGNNWLQTGNNSMTIAIIGKTLPYTIAFTIVFFVVDIFLFKIMHYPLHNGIGWILLGSFLFVLANQALGIFMIGIFPVLRDGLSFASLFGVLSFSFAGLSFPIEGMLPFMQGWSYLFPIRHYFLIYQDIALNGLNPHYAFAQYLYLTLFLLIPFLIGKRLKNALISGRYPKK
jgi:ABC-2 type transport system permease protein